MATEKLKAGEIETLPAGRHSDGGNLFLQVGKQGGRSWLFRYQVAGRERWMGLGSLRDVSLKRARQLATAAREAKADKVDPLEQRRQKRAAARVAEAKSMSFQQCADTYIAIHEVGWKNVKHIYQWRQSLAHYAYPVIGALPVSEIDEALIVKVLAPIWQTKTETASRLRGRIETILDYAATLKYRTGDNPARWKGHMQNLLPNPTKIAKVEHLAALPYVELPTFMADLSERDSTSAHALEFTILTAARTGETIGAQWNEIDMGQKVWTVPAERMKGGRQHRVPLSDRAITILQDMAARRESGFVFPGQRKAGLSNMALLGVLRVMNRAVTVHGFRSAFRTWAAERSNFQREVAEAALAHVVGDQVERSYQRGDLFEKRRKLMDAWASYCAERQTSNVVSLHA
jgi:integrase